MKADDETDTAELRRPARTEWPTHPAAGHILNNMKISPWLTAALTMLLLSIACEDSGSFSRGLDAGPADADASEPGDGGLVDASGVTDAGTISEAYDLYFTKRTGTVLTTTTADWSNIDLEPLEVDANDDRWLLALSVPEAWGAQIDVETWFELRVDGRSVARGLTSPAVSGQKIPINVMAVETLAVGRHRISASWRTAQAGATASIGAEGVATLIAMKVPDDAVAVTRGGMEFSVVSSRQQIDFPSATVTSTGAEYLVILNAPDATNDTPLPVGTNWYHLMVDGVELTSGGTFQALPGTRLPNTLAGIVNLPPGAHTITADLTALAGTTSSLGRHGDAWLIALRLPAGAVHASRIGSISSVANENWTSIGGLAEPTIESAGDNHLIIMAAPDSWSDSTGGGPWFSLDVDGAPVAAGGYTTGVGQQRVSTTMFTAASLDPGPHQLRVRWHHRGPGASYVGANHRTWLIGLR